MQSLRYKNAIAIEKGISKKFISCDISVGKKPKNIDVKSANIIITISGIFMKYTIIKHNNIDIEKPKTKPLKTNFSFRLAKKLSYISDISSLVGMMFFFVIQEK